MGWSLIMGWSNQRMVFYDSFMQKRVDDNNNVMYSTHDESKSVIPERLINALKNKVWELKIWELMIANLILVIWRN